MAYIWKVIYNYYDIQFILKSIILNNESGVITQYKNNF